MLQYVTVSCSVLQCVAVCCSVLQCVAVCCSVLSVAMPAVSWSGYACCTVVLYFTVFAECCSVLQCVAVCCSVSQRDAASCGELQ